MNDVSIAEIDRDQVALEINDLRKSFGGNPALDGVSLTVRRAEVRGLLGPNGAGKSTLIKILTGVYSSDSGEVKVHGRRSAADGRVGVIHQDLGLINSLTVRENLSLGRSTPTWGRTLIASGPERRRAGEELSGVGLDVDPETPLSDLSLGERTLVAVARLLALKADVIVLDEVTAALSQRESTWLLERIRQISETGVAVIFVSHRLAEVVRVCDRTTVLRDGRVAYEGSTPAPAALHRILIGGESEFEREHLRSRGDGRPLIGLREAIGHGVGPISLDVHAGEVLGLIGPLSSNLYQIGHLLAGRLRIEGGRRLQHSADGHEGRVPVAFLAEDRKGLGILPLLDLRDNMTIGSIGRAGLAGFVSSNTQRERVNRMMQDLNIQPPDVSAVIDQLSGGNQQKVLLGRCELMDPLVYVLCEPTRGVDIATRHAIYRFIDQKRSAGAGIVVISVDPDDILAVADRVATVDGGRIEAPIPRSEMTLEDLLEKI